MLYLGILLILIIGFGFLKLIKKDNYELNFKESLLYHIQMVILILVCLVDVTLIKINIRWSYVSFIVPCLSIYYYIIRSIKLKKYIPIKVIISYIIISIIDLLILFNINLTSMSNIDGWDFLGLYLIYLIFCIGYVSLLLLINIIIFVIKSIKKDNKNYRNIDYKLGKVILINFIITILIIGLIYGIDSYNNHNYKKLIEEQKILVIDYLNKEYPEYDFDIINVYEEKVGGWGFGSGTPVFKNEIETKSLNKNFFVDVRKENLTIYNDDFKEIYKNIKEENIKDYLIDNYNLSIKYEKSNDKLKDVEFVINKDYKKDDINLFVKEMKEVFNYFEKNSYDLEYIILDFKNGNPFYEGEYEYSKTKGSIKDNTLTNELWIMVNNEYIFMEK